MSRLGTTSASYSPMNPIDMSAQIAGAMKMPSACVTTRSRRNSPTSRGVYWPAPNCTTSRLTEMTSPVKAIMPPAIADSSVSAVSLAKPSASTSCSPSTRAASCASTSAPRM